MKTRLELLTLGLCGWALGALYTAQLIGLQLLIIAATAFVLASSLARWLRRLPRYELIINGLVLLWLASAAMRFYGLQQGLVELALELVLVLMNAKIILLRGRQDRLQVVTLAFLTMAIALVASNSAWTTLCFFFFLPLSVIIIALGESEIEADPRLAEPPSLPALLGLCGVVGLLAAGVFLALPRPAGPLMRPGAAQELTGFSSSIDLTEHGRIDLDERRVFTVSGPDVRSHRYWRGRVLDYFDGRRWLPLSENSRPLVLEPGMLDELGPELEVRLVNLQSAVLFAPPGTREIELIAPQSRTLSPDSAWSFSHPFLHATASRYRLRPPAMAAADKVLAPTAVFGPRALPQRIRRGLLQLPPGLDPRMRRLAAGLKSANPAATAHHIESYLRSFEYSLERPPRGQDPIAHFLFDSQRGHCELYSSSMVLLLRLNGIAARNVLGFQGGDWEAYSQRLVFRRYHAHSWVEAFIPGRGWVSYDPTPASDQPIQRAPEPGLLAKIEGRLDYRWERLLWDFGPEDQAQLWALDLDGSQGQLWLVLALWLILIAAQLLLPRKLRWPKRAILVIALGQQVLLWVGWPGAPWGVMIVASLFSALSLYGYWPTEAKPQVRPLVRLYLSWQRALERSGHSEWASTAPAAQGEAMAAAGYREGAQFVRHYAELRFGRGQPNTEEMRRLRGQLRAAQAELKARAKK